MSQPRGDRAILRRRHCHQALLVLFAGLLLATAWPVRAGEDRLPFPAELRRDVDFWIRIYSEVGTSEGLLHDDRDLSIVYRKMRFDRDVTARERRQAVDAERERIQAMLRRLAAGASDLSEDEQSVAAMFGPGAARARFAEAAKGVRFQLGQADRFRAGLERSGIWESHIARTFAARGLPPELAALPHVESSFDPTAYSKVGAAGMWQFMRATGRRFLRIDDAVDERMDPFRATEAAALLLEDNYRQLGSWPLALTAYNHGTAGMRRARDAMGTTDIAVIVRNHSSPSFGFASRNFYVSFLAALAIDRDPARYFPDVRRQPEMTFTEVEVPAFVPMPALEKAVRVERAQLRALNPALLAPVWSGRLYVPKGYRLRLPATAAGLTATMLAQQIDATEQYVNQPRARSHRVRSGETLTTIARRYGLTAATLARLNGLQPDDALQVRQSLRLPDVPATRVVAVRAAQEAGEPGATLPPGPAPAPAERVSQALDEQRAESRAAAARAITPEPVSAAEAQAEGPALVPGGAVARATESIDFSVDASGRIRVGPEETIGHYAQWLDVPASRLRSLNGLATRASVPLGRPLRLDFSKVTHGQFEARRRAFHETLQASFFAGHRIVGTLVYVVRGGDSLWSVAQRHGALPAWLVLHYNPAIDFSALRAGQEIVIPKVEALSPG